MTPEAQQIACAESQGWNRLPAGGWYPPNLHPLSNVLGHTLPDYDDLNVIHELEKTLTNKETLHYASIIMERVIKDCEWTSPSMNFTLLHATAAQRREAYLRVKGLWKDA